MKKINTSSIEKSQAEKCYQKILYVRLNSLSDVGLAGTEALVDDGVDATFTGFDKLLHDDISLSLPKEILGKDKVK